MSEPLALVGRRRADSALIVDPSQVLAAAGAENFPVAMRVLPRSIREHLGALYAYARLVDDIGDGAIDPDVDARGALLDALAADLERVWTGQPHFPVLFALQRTARACGLSAQPFRDLLAAGRQDLTVRRYADLDALHGSCRLSADPVGRVVLEIFGVSNPWRVELSDSVCTALQLLEHSQDVGEDFAAGMVYLPQDLLARHGVDDARLAADVRDRNTSAPVRAAVREIVAAARLGLAPGRVLVASLQGAARIAVAGFVAGGLATADALEAADYDVLGQQVRPRRGRTARHAAGLAAPRRVRDSNGDREGWRQ
jgi:squalene synthase HpnC